MFYNVPDKENVTLPELNVASSLWGLAKFGRKSSFTTSSSVLHQDVHQFYLLTSAVAPSDRFFIKCSHILNLFASYFEGWVIFWCFVCISFSSCGFPWLPRSVSPVCLTASTLSELLCVCLCCVLDPIQCVILAPLLVLDPLTFTG